MKTSRTEPTSRPNRQTQTNDSMVDFFLTHCTLIKTRTSTVVEGSTLCLLNPIANVMERHTQNSRNGRLCPPSAVFRVNEFMQKGSTVFVFLLFPFHENDQVPVT